MASFPSVAVVILNWNGADWLRKYLPSVQNSTYPNLSIVVADNGSSDDSVQLLKSSFPEIKLVLNHKNLGFAGGYNAVLNQLTEDYFILLNNDVEVSPNWIEPLISILERDKTIAIVQPKILAAYQRDRFEYAGGAGGYLDRFGYPFARGRIMDHTELDKGQYDDERAVFWATGCALCIRKSVWNLTKGFDSDFFAHMEEIDLCWRTQRAGFQVFYSPDSIVYHFGAGSLPKSSPFKSYLNFRNNLMMLVKNFSRKELIFILPIRWILDGVAFFRAFFTGDLATAKSINKAHIHFLKALPLLLKKRKEIKQILKSNNCPSSPNIQGRYKGSIIYDHFIKGKKAFQQILK